MSNGAEFGIFAEDGQLERGFDSLVEAEKALAKRYSPEDEAHAGECCHDHPEHEAATCELCDDEEEETEETADESEDE